MTIEERAIQYCNQEGDSSYDAYVKGATDQRAIDIDKACEWLKRELAEPMPEELYQQWCNEKLADFRKAMITNQKEL